MKVKNSRGIAMKLICCMAVVVLTSVAAFSATPKSGAMLEINGSIATTPNATPIDLRLYDSQIHSGAVKQVPINTPPNGNCTAADQIPTDAYVLQGGAPTGCDPNDPFEVTDNNAEPHQESGLKSETKFSGFHIETHYLSEPVVSISSATFNSVSMTTTYTYSLTRGASLAGGQTIVITGFPTADSTDNGMFVINSSGLSATSFTVNSAAGVSVTPANPATGIVSNAVCNTSGKICANPDSGFLTVTNNSGFDFTGTISLTGTSTGCGAASDSADFSTSALINGASVTLALGTPGAVGSPTEIDSSNCGGFNQAQTVAPSPLSSNVTSKAFFGKDDYQITPLGPGAADTLSVLPVPVPAGPLGSSTFGPFSYNFPGCTAPCTSFQPGQFGTETPKFTSPLLFSAGTDPNLGGTKFACVPYADFSADKNPMCVELQITPNNNDFYIYTVQNDFDIDGFSLPGGIGGPAFLGHHLVPCPDSAFDQNLFLSYTAANITFGDPLKGSGGGTGSCWVVAFDPSAVAVTTSTASFTGFAGLTPPGSTTPIQLNPVNPGSAEPLNFTFPTAGLKLCSTVNNSGSSCTGGASTPWVAFGTLPIDCTTGAPTAPLTTETTLAAGGSNLQTISTTPSLTSYRFNWKTKKTATLGSCVVVITQFSSGLFVYPDDFIYMKQ